MLLRTCTLQRYPYPSTSTYC